MADEAPRKIATRRAIMAGAGGLLVLGSGVRPPKTKPEVLRRLALMQAAVAAVRSEARAMSKCPRVVMPPAVGPTKRAVQSLVMRSLQPRMRSSKRAWVRSSIVTRTSSIRRAWFPRVGRCRFHGPLRHRCSTAARCLPTTKRSPRRSASAAPWSSKRARGSKTTNGSSISQPPRRPSSDSSATCRR